MRLSVLTLAVVAALAGPAWANADDFGDAPDGRPAQYAADLTVRGAFPSRAASAGPRHGGLGPWLGTGATSEPESRQVDADADDGAMLQLRGCALSTLRVIVDARRLPAGATAVYVNAWFDWNADGDWRDGRASRACGTEWGVQNLRIPRARFGPDGVAAIPVRFRAGRLPPEFWWRVQVQAEATVRHEGGRAGAFRGGETEDFLQFTRGAGDIQYPPGGFPRLRCTVPVIVMTHDWGIASVSASFDDTGTRISNLSATLSGDTRGLRGGLAARVLPSWQANVHVGVREHRRSPRVQLLVAHLRLDATYAGQTRRLAIACRLAIVHEPWITRVEGTQRMSGPAAPHTPPAPTACKLRFDFVVDGSRVPDNGFANFGAEASFADGTRVGDARLTDRATGTRPPGDYFGTSFTWEEFRRPVPGSAGRLHLDFFVSVRDFIPDARPAPRRATWRYEIPYTPPQGGTCDARVERS